MFYAVATAKVIFMTETSEDVFSCTREQCLILVECIGNIKRVTGSGQQAIKRIIIDVLQPLVNPALIRNQTLKTTLPFTISRGPLKKIMMINGVCYTYFISGPLLV